MQEIKLMEFKERLKDLIQQKNNGSQKNLSLATAIPASTINCWFTKDIKPTYVQIIKLAQYFGVTTDYLLGLEDDFGHKIETKSDTYTTEERKLINDFRQLSPALKKMLQDTIATWQHSEANKQTKNNA